jgi:hypothetical protein
MNFWSKAVAGLILLTSLSLPPAALADPGEAVVPLSDCERAGREAERSMGLPEGLLLAIGRVESGRWDPVLRRVVPWPWAIDAAGSGELLGSKPEAVAQARLLLASLGPSLDVGCFQISLRHHPDAFADLNQAFDPVENARYAAHFLVSLRQRLGSWESAVAAYHSALPEQGIPYRQRVFAQWMEGTGLPRAAATDPVVVVSTGAAGVRVWTPSPPGAAASVVSLGATLTRLPRVMTSRP